MLPIIKKYNSNIRAVGTKLPETIEFLKLYSNNYDIDILKKKIVDENIFNIGNLRTIKNLFATLKARYAFDSQYYDVKDLTTIVNSTLDIEIIKSIIFLYFAQYEYATFEVMTECIYPLKRDKFNKLNGSTVLSFFDGRKNDHPEYAKWSKNSYEIFSSMMLTVSRDFGFIEKKNNKEYIILNRLLPLETVGYLLYYIKKYEDDIVNSQIIKLFLITPQEFIFYIKELSKEGLLEYTQFEDKVNIELKYSSLDEYINKIVGR